LGNTLAQRPDDPPAPRIGPRSHRRCRTDLHPKRHVKMGGRLVPRDNQRERDHAHRLLRIVGAVRKCDEAARNELGAAKAPTHQATAQTRTASTLINVITLGSTMPYATVAATLKKKNAPTKLRTAALRTATRGDSARVETLVAIAFAVSWNPFVKSKNSAIAT